MFVNSQKFNIGFILICENHF